MSAPMRPVLRYYGGKYRLAPWIVSFFPPHRCYVELFGGAASVLMRKPRAPAEVYNELDGELVNLFRVLRDPEQAGALKRLLELTPYAREEWADSYQDATDPIERARRSIARAFMGFGSSAFLVVDSGRRRTGFRGQSHGFRWSLPSQDWAGYSAQVPVFCERLRGVTIECRDFETIVREYDGPDVLVYADPPYVPATRAGRDHWYRHDMTDDDHRRLARCLHAVSSMVVLSGYPHALYDLELYAGWSRHECRAWADGRCPRTEVVWLNQAASTAWDAARAQRELGLSS